MIPWHRLFGLTLTDYFHDTVYKVEIEKDLSLKQQLLDVVILERKEGARRCRRSCRTAWKIFRSTT